MISHDMTSWITVLAIHMQEPRADAGDSSQTNDRMRAAEQLHCREQQGVDMIFYT